MPLNPTFVFGGINLAAAPYLVEFGHDRGSPEQVVESLVSALRDGDLTTVTRYGNREITIPIVIEAPTQALLAQYEAALVTEARRPRNEFAFNPGDGTAATTVYDTFEASLVPAYSDAEEMSGLRRYALTFEAHPWGRSAAKVITPAVVAAAPTAIDTGSVTTNWTAPHGPTGATVSVVSGAVTETYNASLKNNHPTNPYYGPFLKRTVSITTTSKYIGIDYKSSISGYIFAGTDSGSWMEVRREPGTVAGFTRSWFKVPDAMASTAYLNIGFDLLTPGSGSQTFGVDQILQANALPGFGTTRQKIATIDPGGSVPAEGMIKVEHSTAGLGQTIVYSGPSGSGYTPPLRQWRSSSDTVSVDGGTVSGSSNPLVGISYFIIPAQSVPLGDVQFWVRLKVVNATGAVRIFHTASSSVGTTLVGDGQGGNTIANFPVLDTWYLFPLARFTLPSAYVGSAGSVHIQLQKDNASLMDIRFDEGWLFAMDAGRLTALDCGTGTPAAGSVHNRLRVSAPSLTNPNGRIEVATAADFSDGYTPTAAKVLCDQTGHKFDPAGSAVFTVTSGANDASVSLEHYPRWHSNAGS